MKCSKAAQWISEYIDGELEAGKASRLEAHLAGCPACRALADDFRAISGTARRIEAPAAPGGAWTRIRAGLRAAEAPAPAAPLFGRFKPVYGLAAAAVAVIGLGALYLALSKAPAASSIRGERERYALAKLDEAEKYYEKAIKALGEAIAGENGRLSPAAAEMFAGNLAAVDASIQACRLAVRNEPDDVKARDFLLAAYRKKLVLLDDILDMNRNANPGLEPGKAI
jgi:hypothetical protein